MIDLLNFLFLFGIDRTTNFDLMDIAKYFHIHKEIKIVMRDELKGIHKNSKKPRETDNSCQILAYLINIQSSKDGNGTHWVLLYNNNDESIYYDSYGIKPIKEVMNLNPIYYPEQTQITGTSMCRQLCMFVLINLLNEQDFGKVLNEIEKFMEKINCLKINGYSFK